MRVFLRVARSCGVALAGIALYAAPLPAQLSRGGGEGLNEVFVGSELEQYLRLLQITGAGRLYPFSLRAFSPAEVDRLLPQDSAAPHPWQDRYPLRPDTSRGLVYGWIPPRVRLFYNSAFPYGANDGAIWAGKGLTTAVEAGVSARYRGLSLTLDPVLFRAENQGFSLASTTLPNRFDDPLGIPIDLPQRFGDGAYTRLDPGQSTLRLDARGVAVGVSTANQGWGPAVENPLILGNNAAGFPHLFFGTSRPVNLWIGRAHGRVIYGRLESSAYTPYVAGQRTRFVSGIVGTFTPRGIPGLEVGGARFFESYWPQGGIGWSDLTEPLQSFWKVNTPDPNDTIEAIRARDQKASAFFRWAAPRSGFEFYGEYAREDHNWDLRDFLLEPDHNSGFMLGFQKLWPAGERRFATLRGELLNTQPSHLSWARHQGFFYAGGHTQYGQLLASPAGFGGSGLFVASDYYHPGGRVTLRLLREYRHGRGNIEIVREPDILYGGGAEALFFTGRFDLTAGVDAIHNRDTYRMVTETNLRAQLQVRLGL